MLINASKTKDAVIYATDGEVGTIEQLYFDDETWAIRYLVVDTGDWLTGRQVLISPISITHVDWKAKRVDVSLTRHQVEMSPDVNTHQPVSRQHEAAYFNYYGYPCYWDGPYLWGAGIYPSGVATPDTLQIQRGSGDSHLRSTEAVRGYYIEASDGELGHLDGFILDEETWAIRYIEVATRNWWPGKKVLVSPAWIERVSWLESKTYVGLTREAIKAAPDYFEDVTITREYENRLYLHYGRPPYWLAKVDHESLVSLSS